MKNCDIFLIFAQNLNRGYTLEPPQKDLQKCIPCTPQFHYIKVGCKGVFITRTCLHDVIRDNLSIFSNLYNNPIWNIRPNALNISQSMFLSKNKKVITII